MNWLVFPLIFLCDQHVMTYAQDAAIVPNEYAILFDQLHSVNGSLETMGCDRNSNEGDRFICENPAGSVLSDGAIPRLGFFDNRTWARHLVTLWPAGDPQITFDLSDQSDSGEGIGGVEVVMFNCPQWDIGARRVILLESMSVLDDQEGPGDLGRPIAQAKPDKSCDSLVTVCLLAEPVSSLISLRFVLPNGSRWVHIAEVTFLPRPHFGNNICGRVTPFTALPTDLRPTKPTPVLPSITTTNSDMCPPCDPCTPAVSNTQSVVISGVVSAIVATLLVIVISTITHVLVCRCRPKFKGKKREATHGMNNAQINIGSEQDYLSIISGDMQEIERTHHVSGPRLTGAVGSAQYRNGTATNPLINISLSDQRQEGAHPVGGAECENMVTSGSYIDVDLEREEREYEYEEVRNGERNLKLVRNEAYGIKIPNC